MICFFRSIDTWTALAAPEVVDYTVPLCSVGKTTGKIRVAGRWPALSGCWAVLDGNLYYAQKAAPGDGYTDITAAKPIFAFARDLVYDGVGTEELESFIATQITAHYIQQTDPAYAMPYLTVTAQGTTAADLAYIPNQVYAFTDVLQLAEELGISFSWSMTAGSLALTVAPRESAAHKVFFGDGHNILTSAALTPSLVSKVTVRRILATDDEILVDEETDFYWHADGSITETPPDPRIPGSWAVVSLTDSDIPLLAAAQEAMSGNNAAVRISFTSDRAFGLGDRLTCRIGEDVVTATVTLCTISAGSSRRTYTLGDLPTTLTAKFERAAAKRQEKAVTYENETKKPVTTSGGTVGGPLSVQDVLNATTLVVGSGSWGTTLPASGFAGQLFFVPEAPAEAGT